MTRGWLGCVLCIGAGCAAPRVTVPVMPMLIASPSSPVVWEELFQHLDPQRWREVSVRHRTRYRIVTLDGQSCLEARSQASASILLSPVHCDPRASGWLSWEWRVDELVAKESLATKPGSDVAARVYVYFSSRGLPWQKRSLDYVWSASLPVGTIISSAFSAQSKILVAESGDRFLKQWRYEERNVAEDYQRAFGTQAPKTIAIGVMSDTDNTGGRALAYLRNLRLSRQPIARAGQGRDRP